MFNNLTDRLSNSFKALQGKNKLSESNIKDAIRPSSHYPHAIDLRCQLKAHQKIVFVRVS
jgi:hypothetical protein